jgi:hypothetical protein
MDPLVLLSRLISTINHKNCVTNPRNIFELCGALRRDGSVDVIFQFASMMWKSYTSRYILQKN